MESPELKAICRVICAATLLAVLPACTVVEFGPKVANAAPPAKAKIEFVAPDLMYRTALNEKRLDRIACTFESTDREANKRLRLRLFESLVVTLPSRKIDYEPRSKLVFYFDDGKVETLVLGRRFDQRDTIDAEWQGLRANVSNTLPAELVQFAREAHLAQLNPQASKCDPLSL